MDIILRPEQMEKVKRMLFDTFEERLRPIEGWDNIDNHILLRPDESALGVTIHTPVGLFNYFSCDRVKFWEIEHVTKCPALMIGDTDFQFLSKRFPKQLWKPALMEWWNQHSKHKVNGVYLY